MKHIRTLLLMTLAAYRVRRMKRKEAEKLFFAVNNGGCTQTYAEGVRRLWGGLPPHVSTSGNPPHLETPRMQPLTRTHGTGGGPGGIAFSDSAPGGFRFLSPCRKEQRYG